MKTINNKKYSKIKSLLKSSNREDATIGLILAAKVFTIKELQYNFPNQTNVKRVFLSSLGHMNLVWGMKRGYILCVSDQVFCFREKDYDGWKRTFKDKEIKL